MTRFPPTLLASWTAAGVAAVAAWWWLAGVALGTPHVHPPGPASFGVTVVTWQAMVVAMMAPVVAPWLGAFAKLLAPVGGRTTASVTAFAAGYFLVWLAYSVLAAALQLALQQIGASGAGVAQFLPLKRACLRPCRNPLSYLIAHWRNGPPNGLRLGAVHGAFCLGCCWLLMLTGLALGVMNLAWMAVLTVVIVLEQTPPAASGSAAPSASG